MRSSQPGTRVTVALVAAAWLLACCSRGGGATDTCGRACWGDGQCVTDAPFTTCSICQQGFCAPGAQCGYVFSCSVDLDCNQNGTCALCDVGSGTCKRGCGQKCASTAECNAHGCDDCFNGRCRLLDCGTACTTDATCSATCPYCYVGTCRARCFQPCNVDRECPGPCPSCVNGTCNTWAAAGQRRRP